jgi:hypothetical protein
MLLFNMTPNGKRRAPDEGRMDGSSGGERSLGLHDLPPAIRRGVHAR